MSKNLNLGVAALTGLMSVAGCGDKPEPNDPSDYYPEQPYPFCDDGTPSHGLPCAPSSSPIPTNTVPSDLPSAVPTNLPKLPNNLPGRMQDVFNEGCKSPTYTRTGLLEYLQGNAGADIKLECAKEVVNLRLLCKGAVLDSIINPTSITCKEGTFITGYSTIPGDWKMNQQIPGVHTIPLPPKD